MYPMHLNRNSRPVFSPLMLVCGVAILLSGCAQTLRQQYMSADDPCSSAREPIVKAGDDLDQQYRQMAQQQAAAQMKGHELPVMQQVGNQTQFNFGNLLSNAIQQASLTNDAYIKLKQQETGANAAAMLASVQGDASTDNARMKSVTHAMSALRTCRRNQIAAVRNSPGPSDTARVDKLRQQQTELDKDDQLIGKVFGQYANRAQVYADATATVFERPAAAGVHRPANRPSRTSVDVFKDDQHNAQVADRKQSETLHETLQNSLGA
jgi:hypothetical protein